MAVAVLVTPVVFETARAAARSVGESGHIDGLGSPLGAAVKGRLAEIWDGIDRALEAAYQFGLDGAYRLRDAAIAMAERAIVDAKDRAEELRIALVERLRQYVRSLVDGALQQVEPVLRVGGVELALADITVSQRVVLGGSLKASITEAVSVTASGEVSIDTRYAIRPVA